MRRCIVLCVLLSSFVFAQQTPAQKPQPAPVPQDKAPSEKKPSGGNVQATTPPSSTASAQPQRPKMMDLDAMDLSINPCEDFYAYACGGWQKANPIPPDQVRWGRFELLREYNRGLLRQILDTAAAKRAFNEANEQKIADYYGSCMDEPGINAKGLAPAQRWLKEIDGIKTAQDLSRVVTTLHNGGINAMFSFRQSPQLHNAMVSGAWADQGGLGLPNKDFYTKTDEKSVKIRQQYVEHIAKMLKLLGTPTDQAVTQAQQVMDIETKLAEASMDPTSRRDTNKLDHWMKRADFQALAPGFAWDKYFEGLGAPQFAELNVGVPDFFKNLGSMLNSVPLEQWKTYLKWQFVHSQADALPTAFVEENFDFNGRILNGAEQNLPLWNRCVRATDADLGEALGRYYVEKAFGGNAKERTLAMVHQIERAMEADIKQLDWMTDETKQKALVKLHAVANKIGYPDKWRDYSKLIVIRGDRLGNSLRANEFEFHRQLAKIGKPVDRTEWTMTPPTVNAYYSPLQNNINFPAGILQPPFFDNGIDDAVNYGAIGLVIGHELSHGFDDSGARFDANGNLKNWWSEKDKTEFDKRTGCIADEYSGFSPVEGEHLNGRLTLGENTADNGGARLALMALLASYAGNEPPKKDNFTPEQRFFVGFGQVWCENVRPERARTLVKIDPHSPGKFRVNGVVQNMPEFQKAFGCKAGQAMVSTKACRVW